MVINSERVPRTYGKNCVQGNQCNEPKFNAQKQIYLIISHHYLNKFIVIWPQKHLMWWGCWDATWQKWSFFFLSQMPTNY